MTTADNYDRIANTVKRSGVIKFDVPKDSGTTNITRDAGPAGYGTPGLYSSPTNAGATVGKDAAINIADGFNNVTSGGTRTPQSQVDPMTAFLSMLNGGSSNKVSASDALAQAKFDYEKKQDALKRAGLQDYYNSGSYNNNFDNILKMINEQGGVSQKGITDAYGRAEKNINEGYNVASGLGTQGYNALNTYLNQNQNNPYAGMQATTGTAPDALSQFLAAYNVSDQPVQAQVAADQLQAQQGAGNYQNLIDLLSSVAQQGAASRGAESQMAQNLFNTSLGQERAGYQSQATNAQAQALAQLAAELAQQRIGVESNRGSLENQLALAVAEAGGNANTKSGSGSGSDGKNENALVLNQLANLTKNMNLDASGAQQLLNDLNARRGY